MEVQVNNEEPVEKEAPKEKKDEAEHAPPKRAENPFSDSLDTYPTLPKNLQLKTPLLTINKISPDIKPKFGIGNASSTKEEVSKKKKVPRGCRNKKIPTEGFSPGMKVVLTSNLV
ncbi:hypothetical protein AHAS_Ahas12G0088700 [Arachis hypogaea]